MFMPSSLLRALRTDRYDLRLIHVDDYIESLWNIHLKVKEEGYVQVGDGIANCSGQALIVEQDLALGLFRSDYMVHVDPNTDSPTPCLRQVEFNTIASSFGGLSSRVSQLHK